MSFKLTQADKVAISNGDHTYINRKGVNAYKKEDYKTAVAYYRLAAAMGNKVSVSNLGYCYMYGRSIEKNMDLAVEYFKIAAGCNVIDAIYKLGSIYFNGATGVKEDKELGLYYFRKAIDQIEEQELDPVLFPSLHYALAKEMMPGGFLPTDLPVAFNYLMVAHIGYEEEIADGAKFYEEVDQKVIEAMDNPCFDEVKQILAELEELEDEEYEFDEDYE